MSKATTDILDAVQRIDTRDTGISGDFWTCGQYVYCARINDNASRGSQWRWDVTALNLATAELGDGVFGYSAIPGTVRGWHGIGHGKNRSEAIDAVYAHAERFAAERNSGRMQEIVGEIVAVSRLHERATKRTRTALLAEYRDCVRAEIKALGKGAK